MNRSQADKGFVPLFNGKDLSGWVVDSGDSKRWQVSDGQIVGIGSGSSSRGWLLSEKEYANFILNLEFQVAAEADGTVGFRALSGEMVGNLPHHLAVKLTGYSKPNRPRSGALYWWPNTWEQPKKAIKLRPEGDWNELAMQVQGQELLVWVNGQEAQKLSLDQFARKEKGFPGLKRSSGRIGLQQHTGEIRFRKIEIKDLRPTPTP